MGKQPGMLVQGIVLVLIQRDSILETITQTSNDVKSTSTAHGPQHLRLA